MTSSILHRVTRASNQPPTVTKLPCEPGVYRFRDARGRVIYLGRASDLRHRVASYWGELTDRRHLRRMVPQIHRVEAVICDSVHEAAWLERNLLEASMPRWNRIAGGLEVPTFIRLEHRPRSARLTVAHSPTPSDQTLVFGPYLGGGRTRLAVAALDRVLSLSYAADSLGGFDRDMARVRSVQAGERELRIQEVADILGREPIAVGSMREELRLRRDAAAAALAFEVAARIQDELEAIDWVTSEQKVTVPEPCDADVHGWADGILVRFDIRRGRMCRWQQRPCTAPVAARLVAATPTEWAGFARRSAELARALRDDDGPAS